MPTETERPPQQEARAESFSELRAQSHAQIERETAERVKNNPKPAEDEVTAGAFHEMIEPQVRDAVFEMRKKGYATESSGFGGKSGEVQQIDGNFEIDQKTAEMLRRNGISVVTQETDEAIPWKTSLRFSTDSVPGPLTIENLKEKWDGIVGLLPNLEKPAEPSVSSGTEDFIKERAPERTDVLNRIKELREKYEREREESRARKGEETKVDAKYFRTATEHFADVGYDKDPDTAEYGREIEKGIDLLSREDELKKLQPKEVATLLSQLAGEMSSSNPAIEGNLSGDPKMDAENEKRYLEAKKLFMESSARTFPDAKVDFSQIHLVVGRLRTSLDNFAAIEDITGVEKLQREDPKQLADKLDGLLYFVGSSMQDTAYVISKSDVQPAEREKYKGKLAQATEAVYKLQLLRDQLQQEMYGRAEVPPSDARKIDTIREEFKPEGEKKPKYILSEYGAYTPEAAQALQERVGALDMKKTAATMREVADFLSTRPESHNLTHLEEQMRELGKPLELDNPTEEQLAAALKGVENQYHLIQWVPSLQEKMPALNAMRHFLRSELQKMREAKAPETKEEEPALKTLKEKASRAASYLQERGVKINLAGLRLENDVDRWRKAADGLDTIRSTFLKDNDPAFKKVPKYQPEVDKLFELLKR